MTVRLEDGEVEHVELRIFEPPRFFEALLRGRAFTEAPDITARICGICPVAYQTSAVNALEQLCGVEVPEPIRMLRRLLYCGEWIESHALHVYMLHAPDFLGYAGAVELARDAPAAVERGLALKKTGNALMTLVGGREIHPINVRVGGFYRAPTRRELRGARRAARAGAGGGARDGSLDGGVRLPRADGRVRARRARRSPRSTRSSAAASSPTRGLDISPAEYDEHFEELHVERSNALHSRLRERGTYLCGPLARYTLNHDRLSPLAREAAREAGLGRECRDPFRSIVVRSVELVYACDEALRLIEAYEEPDAPAVAGRARRRDRLRRQRGAARAPLPPLPARRRGHDPRREDRAADLAEPARDRGRPPRRRRPQHPPRRRPAARPLRADDPQLRPVHLLRHALPRPSRSSADETRARPGGGRGGTWHRTCPTAAGLQGFGRVAGRARLSHSRFATWHRTRPGSGGSMSEAVRRGRRRQRVPERRRGRARGGRAARGPLPSGVRSSPVRRRRAACSTRSRASRRRSSSTRARRAPSRGPSTASTRPRPRPGPGVRLVDPRVRRRRGDRARPRAREAARDAWSSTGSRARSSRRAKGCRPRSTAAVERAAAACEDLERADEGGTVHERALMDDVMPQGRRGRPRRTAPCA